MSLGGEARGQDGFVISGVLFISEKSLRARFCLSLQVIHLIVSYMIILETAFFVPSMREDSI